MKISLALLLVPVMGVVAAQASPGVTTADVNFRAGPGTDTQSFGVLPNGTAIDIGNCDQTGWCAITVNGVDGYASQQYVETTAAPATGDGSGNAPQFTADQLDTLVAPVALYPDSVLAQVLVAVTYPLDIVKAQRWIAANTDMPADKRAAATTAEGWDQSVATLAAGFPAVIDQLGNDLDNTQELGDAMIVQSDDVMAAVQRQRAKAKALGNLDSNQAQVVTVTNNNISIAPAKPDVVYVPTYNPTTVYTTAAPAPVYVDTGSTDYTAGAVLATGAISFAAGYAVSSVFNNDNWHNYWYGPPRINWNNGYIYPRPGYRPNVNVNVNNGNINIGNRVGDTRVGNNRIGNNGGRWQPTARQRENARQTIDNRHGGGARVGTANNGRRPGGANRRPTPSSVERGLTERRHTGAKAPHARERTAPRANTRTAEHRRAQAPRRSAGHRQSAFHQPEHRRAPAAARARGNRSRHYGGGGGRREFRGGGRGHRGGGRR